MRGPLRNPRHEAFCQYYVNGAAELRGNATASYLAAGYETRGPSSAYAAASRLMRRPDVRQRVDELAASSPFGSRAVN